VSDVGSNRLRNTQGFLTKNVKEIFWDLEFLSEVTGCRKPQVSDRTGSTVYNVYIYRFSFSCPWVMIFLHSREWRNIVTHMGNWRRICFSHYLTWTLFQNPIQLLIWQHAGKGTRHFNPLEDYRFFHHWFNGVKTP
jgi:hypothetical protein